MHKSHHQVQRPDIGYTVFRIKVQTPPFCCGYYCVLHNYSSSSNNNPLFSEARELFVAMHGAALFAKSEGNEVKRKQGGEETGKGRLKAAKLKTSKTDSSNGKVVFFGGSFHTAP